MSSSGPALMPAASGLKSVAPQDVGSLYYVLGAQASSSRVKQLQHMLQLRRNAEQQQRQQQRQNDEEAGEAP